MSYVVLVTAGAGILSWPLWQGEIPSDLGSWPLTVVVMVFCFIVIKVIRDWMNDKDAKFAERMVEKDKAFSAVVASMADKHAEAVESFSKTLMEVQTIGHAHGDLMREDNAAMRRSVDRLASVISRLEKKPRKK